MSTTAITPHPDFARILRDQETFAVEGDASVGNRLNGWFDRLMLQSGMELSPGSVLGLSLVSAIALGGAAFVYQENLLTTAIGTAVGAILPIVTAIVLRSRRQSQMNKQLPAMIEELARAAKTGRSLEQCLIQVADGTAQPLGGEMRRVTHKLSLGLGVEQSLAELPGRTGLVGTKVLSTALSVHRQTGGDLVKVLQRLAQTLRDRLQFQGRLKTATSTNRAAVILMIVLPPLILAFFMFRDPEYLSTLFGSTWGLRITLTAFLLEFLGAVWVLRILQQSQKY